VYAKIKKMISVRKKVAKLNIKVLKNKFNLEALTLKYRLRKYKLHTTINTAGKCSQKVKEYIKIGEPARKVSNNR
jgi:hypothetical protein